MNLEGILINKTPYKERDLICKVLLRNGKVTNLYFYGGRGGGKLNKGSILEIGHMIKVTLAPKRKRLDQEIHIAKEWNLIWEANHIRSDFHAFYLISFIFELIQKIAIEDHLEEDHDKDDHAGIFKTVSNCLFYLDKMVSEKAFHLNSHLFMFLGKLSIELGIVPDFGTCLHCHCDLEKVDLMRFDPQNGGFICRECLLQIDDSISSNKHLFNELSSSTEFRKILKYSLSLKFSEVQKVNITSKGLNEALFNYFCYQFHFQPIQFKTWSSMINL